VFAVVTQDMAKVRIPAGDVSADKLRARPVRVMTRGFCDMLSELYDRTYGAE
jgi:hypothetical protein